MKDVFEICGWLLLTVSVYFLSYKLIAYTHRNLELMVYPREPLFLRCVVVAMAGTIGVVLASVTWSLSSSESAVGFPLPWTIWLASDTGWQGSTNPIRAIPWLADLSLGLALVHLPIALLCFSKRRRIKAAANAT